MVGRNHRDATKTGIDITDTSVRLHSSDHVADECLKISVCISPADWTSFVSKKELPFEKFEELGSVEAAGQYLVNKYADSLVNGPLVQKVRRLQALCSKAEASRPEGYRYDEERVTELNSFRNSIAHDAGVFGGLLAEDVKFLILTGSDLLARLQSQYGIQLGAALMEEALSRVGGIIAREASGGGLDFVAVRDPQN